jgi:hypothetical protein
MTLLLRPVSLRCALFWIGLVVAVSAFSAVAQMDYSRCQPRKLWTCEP